ncbi:MAG: hypothetical protein COY64_08960, partial [Hydrogenophilales bacterium CG_4_10_14_0_8_um_filter_62_70]
RTSLGRKAPSAAGSDGEGTRDRRGKKLLVARLAPGVEVGYGINIGSRGSLAVAAAGKQQRHN